jgi:ABC-type multidrug transport system fused ATPase/permease subunit
MLSLYLAPKGCTDITAERDKKLNFIHEEIDDMLRNLFSIYGQDQKENEMKRTQELQDVHQDLFKSTIDCIFKYKVLITPVAVIFLCVFMYRCMQLISHHKMNSDKFVPVFIIMLYLLNSMVYTNDQFRDIVFDWGIINAADEIITPNPNKNNDILRTYNDVPTGGIGLKNVSFKYDTGKYYILNDFSLHIADGEKVVIAGDIGSGKSTLLKLFLKYYEPSEGYLYWDGVPYDQISIKELRRRVGYVPQVPILFNRTVLENITYGMDIPRERVIDFLQEYDIMKEFNNLEDGLDTKIGKNGSKLSGGQRQLAWCIRVLLSNPDLIILDEPTASVDKKTKDLLLKLLDTAMKGKTVIMVTHDEYLVSRATRHIYMQRGQIIADKIQKTI